jgi:LPS export ABC transporter protein LptC
MSITRDGEGQVDPVTEVCGDRVLARRPVCVVWLGLLLASLCLAGGPARAQDPERTLDLGDMTYVSSNGRFNEVTLDAETARIEPDQDVAHLETVHAVLAAVVAGARGRGGLDMTCERGTIELDSGDFVAEGDVRGITGDGRRFRTKRLRYDHARGLVTTNDPVSIRDRAGTYRGRGFRYWVRENRFQITGGASVEAN